MIKREVIHGAGLRHQVVKTIGFYWLLDTETDHVRASMSVKGWTVDCEAVFIKYCDKWNSGEYQEVNTNEG